MVICDARSEARLVNGTRTGMHGAGIAEPWGLTVEDEDFLCAQRIRHAR